MLRNTFDRTYVINLPRNKDRVDTFFKNIPADFPFRLPECRSAIDGRLATPPDWWKSGNGAWGAYRSHLHILEDCLNNEINSVLIFEDDAVFVERFTEKVQEFWKHLPGDWEMLYLGGQYIQVNQGLPKKVNDWVYKPFNVNRTHCYGVRGRKMIEMIYKHLNDFFNWKVVHHVDHYLGELHKQIQTGFYVPKEWLVGQAAGMSDISGKELQVNFFPNAQKTLEPHLIDRPCCAVMGTYFGGINTLAGAMQELGLFLGMQLNKPLEPTQPHFFEEVYLCDICRNSYTEPWLEEKNSQSDRISLLRRWAGLQCKYMPKEIPLVCGKHPILSLMGEEIMEAWNAPKFICIERNPEKSYGSMKKASQCWPPDAAQYSFNRLAESREEFFEKYQPPLLRIEYASLKSEPEKILSELCEFLKHVPTSEQRQDALELIRTTSDDCIFLKVVKQPVQVVSEPREAKSHSARDKRKKERKKERKR